ncbi:hypothetical protein LSAT2_007557 [Lamellibrachia satsuma]|nr:hypothetical protein LSAT2_007557 [Lamellibrachia satsuma]
MSPGRHVDANVNAGRETTITTLHFPRRRVSLSRRRRSRPSTSHDDGCLLADVDDHDPPLPTTTGTETITTLHFPRPRVSLSRRRRSRPSTSHDHGCLLADVDDHDPPLPTTTEQGSWVRKPLFTRPVITSREIQDKMSTAKGNTDTAEKANQDNHANQCNPNHPEHKGHQPGYHGTADKPDLDNHANQMNPNNSECKQSKQ